MTTEQAFGDESKFAYQKYKGALNLTAAMRGMQTASAFHVLEHAVAKAANDKLGVPVGWHTIYDRNKNQESVEGLCKRSDRG